MCSLFDQLNQWSMHIMTEIHLIAKLAQGLLALSVTIASVLIFQFALLTA
jgi:hypothetical protein